MADLKQVLDAIETQNEVLSEYKKDVEALSTKQVKNEGGQAEIQAKLAKMDEEFDKIDKIKTDFENEIKKMKAVEAMANVVKTSAHAQTFVNFMRRGDSPEIQAQLKDFEKAQFKNAVDVTTGANGEYAVPDELSREIYRLAGSMNTMRDICRVITVSNNNFSEVVDKKGATVEWVGETDTRSTTDTPSLAELSPYMGEMSALAYATQNSLDDIFFDVGQWLVDSVVEKFIDTEEAACISGNGTKKPKGFLGYTLAKTADASRAFGQIEYLATGKADGFLAPTATVSPGDILVDMQTALKQSHMAGAVWLMSRTTRGTVRKFKDYATGQFLWQPGIQAGTPDTLLGHILKISDSMPTLAADAYPIAFGNFKRGYTIADRLGVRILRDPYSNKPYVGFYVTKRVGGYVKDSEAIKVLKIEA